MPLRGSLNPNWKGGKYTDSRGYVRLLMPEHPRADSKGYVPEHIVIAEKAFGKPLPPKCVVHHHSPVQLVVCENQGYHLLLHKRQRHLNGFVPRRKSYYPVSAQIYRDKNKAKLRAYYAQYREKHREHLREYKRNWWRKKHALKYL